MGDREEIEILCIIFLVMACNKNKIVVFLLNSDVTMGRIKARSFRTIVPCVHLCVLTQRRTTELVSEARGKNLKRNAELVRARKGSLLNILKGFNKILSWLYGEPQSSVQWISYDSVFCSSPSSIHMMRLRSAAESINVCTHTCRTWT